MYAWLWRKMPYGTRGKILSLLLALAGVLALLWFVIFPFVDSRLPSNNVQVTQNDGVFVAPSTPAATPSSLPT